MARVALPALFVLFVSCILVSCTGKAPDPSPTPAPARPCDGATAHVESLYRAQRARATPGHTGDRTPRARGARGSDGDEAARAERRREEIADHVTMVLADCQRDPAHLLPCVQAATSAEQLERDCLIPLDDEGTVEGRQLGGD